jgi:putative PIN family toxin of toxin-antitoxin system
VLSAVLDINVVVSGTIVKKGTPHELLTALRGRRWNLVISPGILAEIQRVLSFPKISRRYGLTPQDIRDVLHLLETRATVIPGRLKIPPTARDPDDDHILACAAAGHADYVVSGDEDLLSLERYEGIPIVSAAAFAAMLRTIP